VALTLREATTFLSNQQCRIFEGHGRSMNFANGGRNFGSCLGLLASLRGHFRHSGAAPLFMAVGSERCGLITSIIDGG
jgi:hypothetical protein